jgi:hypothetical protein
VLAHLADQQAVHLGRVCNIVGRGDAVQGAAVQLIRCTSHSSSKMKGVSDRLPAWKSSGRFGNRRQERVARTVRDQLLQALQGLAVGLCGSLTRK